jgi:hypothetical protein
VSNSEAFEVLGKNLVGPRPVAYVTVGKPGFVDMAVKNSYSNRLTLINHKTLAETAILILEERRALTIFSDFSSQATTWIKAIFDELTSPSLRSRVLCTQHLTILAHPAYCPPRTSGSD